ncbi:hypothetical protein PMI42_03124 [Bradyrhizobium sp. YR681]|uniref:hypothetical protein n=1 Tax=Bradyrhizobium sp. YR681 TaxID=1144344 RepID=UPI0002711BC9|nr:hypothetical protein [Bradyrhizobium sp. YR681]EJN13551.1 hypothetical protein PMI42_03124 [Bradyrhizobium sp. YR681]
MATPAQNPEIQLGLGARPQGNAVALFGANIFVVGADGNSNMQQSLYNTGAGFTASGLGNKESWSNSRLTLKNGFAPQTTGGCALAIQSGEIPALYLFWNQSKLWEDSSSGVLVTSLNDVTPPPPGSSSAPTANWLSTFVLCDENGLSINLPEGSCVTAVSLGSQAFLVGWMQPIPDQPGKLTDWATVSLYYVADQQPDKTLSTNAGVFGTWPGRMVSQLGLTAAEVGAMLPPVAGRSGVSLDSLISIAVTPQVSGAGVSSNDLSLDLVMFMTVTTADAKGDDQQQFQVAVTCPLDATGSPAAGQPTLAWSSPAATKSQLTILPDPAGRIIACGSSVTNVKNESKALLLETFATYGPLAYAGQTMLPASSADTSTPPSMMFIVDTGNASQTEPTQNSDGTGEMTTTSYPLLQLLFYGETTVAQLQQFGTAEVISNYANMSLSTANDGPAVAVTGIIDGPIPLPDANIIGWQFESTVNDLGSVIYGTSEGIAVQGQQSWNVGASFTANGKIGISAGDESLGDGGEAGIAWSASVSGGYTRNWSSSTSATFTLPWQQSSDASVDHTSIIGLGIVQYGSVFAAPPSISITNLKFFDANGNMISDGTQNAAISAPQAPIFAAISAYVGQSNQSPYVPFLVTPGDLMTYTIDGTRADGTPCGINATMAALTGNAIPDYFDTVIWPAAFDFGENSGGPSQKYLAFSWSLSGVTGGGFTALKSSMNSGSWNVEASLAAGCYWDDKEGLPLLGGVETSGTIMIGGTGGYSNTTTDTTTQQWGVSLQPFGTSPPWGPPNWGTLPDSAKAAINPAWESSVIASYRFVLFLLPDPRPGDASGLSPGYWVQELLKYGNTNAATVNPNVSLPTNLDPGSGAWKIVYVVLEVQTYDDLNNGTYTYQYTDPKGRFS